MFRLALLILTLAALVIFALQNVAPVLPLVILGMQTQALPLAVWVVVAIAAGAVTTILLALLLRLAGGRNRSRRPKPRRASGRATGAGTPWTPPPWTGDRNSAQPGGPVDTASGYGAKAAQASTTDDWEQSRQSSDAWDNWDEARPPVDAPRQTRPSVKTVIQDASYTDVTDRSAAYQPPFYSEPANPSSRYREQVQESFRDEYQSSDMERDVYGEVEGDREEWDDWEEEDLRPPSATRSPEPRAEPEPEPPPRPIVEIQRQPQGGYQTGSVFSYTYRSSDPLPNSLPNSLFTEPAPPDTAPQPDFAIDEATDFDRPQLGQPTGQATGPPTDPPTGQPTDLPTVAPSSSVYDAEFRVIIPPYRAAPEAPTFLQPLIMEPDESQEPSEAAEPEPSNQLQESDDWDEADGDDFTAAPPSRHQPPRESPDRGRIAPDPMEREVWDDWEEVDDEVDDRVDDEADEPPPPPTSPEGNPPLRLG